MSPRLSIVLPCYNAAETLGTQLAAIAAQDCADPWELIIADNGSTDGSRDIAKSFEDRIPTLTIVDASQKRGAAHARNAGAAAARGTVLLFCDADDEMAPGYLRAMAKALQDGDFVAARYDYDRLNSSWLAAARPGGQNGEPMGGFCHPTLPYAGGGGLGVRKALHDAVGGFDTTLRAAAGQEDTDYCIRIQLAGATLRYAPHAVMHIRVKTSVRGLFAQARAWAESGAYIARRYQPDAPQDGVRTTAVNLGKHLAWRLLHLRSRADVAQVIWQAGWSVGWVEARLRMRGHLDGAPDIGVSS
jgi:glycosyltransferase involved in cell wall biosynthesis